MVDLRQFLDLPPAAQAAGKPPTAEQQRIIECGGSAVVLAGAGTGKTETIGSKVVYEHLENRIPLDRIFLGTFTRKGAGEMRARIAAKCGAAPRATTTFHSFGMKILRADPKTCGMREGFRFADRGVSRRIVKHAADDLGAKVVEDVMKELKGKGPGAIVHLIARLKDALVGSDDAERFLAEKPSFLKKATEILAAKATKLIYPVYEKILRDESLVDMADLVYLPTKAIIADDSFRRRLASCYDLVISDEFQDTNPQQLELLFGLASGSKRLIVVGDDDQAIFGWRDADVNSIRDFRRIARERLGVEAAVLFLMTNFRSTGEILDVANHVIGQDKDPKRYPKKLVSHRGSGVRPVVEWFAGKEREAAEVVKRVKAHRENPAIGDKGIALLLRSVTARGSAAPAIARELRAEGIEVRVFGDENFWEMDCVRIAIGLIALVDHKSDKHFDDKFEFLTIGGSFEGARHFGEKSLQTVRDRAKRDGCSLADAFDALTAAHTESMFGGKARNKLASKKGWDSVAATLDVLATVDRNAPLHKRMKQALEVVEYYPNQTFSDDDSGYLDDLLDMAASVETLDELIEMAVDAEEAKESGDFVSIMTIHRAKGGEWPVVFLPSFSENRIPGGSVGKELDEERRVAYVGITRAKSHCYISGAPFTRGGSLPPDRISSFVDELAESLNVEIDDDIFDDA